MTTSRWEAIPGHLKGRVSGGTGGRMVGKVPKKRSGGKRNAHAEDDEQEALFKWARLSAHSHPGLEALISIPNGASLAGNKQQRATQMARLKKQGLRPGVSDVLLPVGRGGFLMLWIEMKRPGNLKGVSQEQKDWGKLMVSLGSKFVVCDTFEKARAVIVEYLKL